MPKEVLFFQVVIWFEIAIPIDQITENSPGEVRNFAATQTSVKDHLLTLEGKTRQK